jgi:hypothetical protein
MLASELVSTAVCSRARTTEPVIELSVHRAGPVVRLEVNRVAGQGAHSRHELAPVPQWTFALLDEFADEWGVVHDECGLALQSWAEIRVGSAAG